MKHKKLKITWLIPSFFLIAQKLLKFGFSTFLLIIMHDPLVTVKCTRLS